MRQTILTTLVLALILAASAPQASAQLVIGKEPGTEVPEVTAGPGWKTCPRCQNNGHIAAARVKYKVDGHPFNAKDLSGVWGNNGISLDSKAIPEMTGEGKKMWEATQAVQTNPLIPAMNGGEGSKDPMLHCDPLGWPRSFTYHYGMEFIMLPDRVVQMFEWGGYHRTIWTDGRKLPDDPPQARFYGYAVGHWEGDVFVVESNGYEDRTWLDQDRRNMQRGLPHSDAMKVVERWHRASYENLEVELTVNDPKVYSKPFVTKGKETLRPGAELSEYYCVPSDSEEYNNELTAGKHVDPKR